MPYLPLFASDWSRIASATPASTRLKTETENRRHSGAPVPNCRHPHPPQMQRPWSQSQQALGGIEHAEIVIHDRQSSDSSARNVSASVWPVNQARHRFSTVRAFMTESTGGRTCP